MFLSIMFKLSMCCWFFILFYLFCGKLKDTIDRREEQERERTKPKINHQANEHALRRNKKKL